MYEPEDDFDYNCVDYFRECIILTQRHERVLMTLCLKLKGLCESWESILKKTGK